MRRRAMGLLAMAALCTFFAIIGMASADAAECPNEAIRQAQGSTYLPECRAYEQVSPVDKNGSDIATPSFFTQSSKVGSAVVFASSGAFAGAESLLARSTYVGTRTVAGWLTRGVDPLQTSGDIRRPGYVTQAFSDDLSDSFLIAGDPQPLAEAEPNGNNLYVRSTAGAYSLLTPVATSFAVNGLTGCRGAFAGADESFSKMVFESSAKLTGDAPIDDPGLCNEAAGQTNMQTNLYEWTGRAGSPGTLKLVSILPDPDGPGPGVGGPAPEGAVAGGLAGGGIATGWGATGSTYSQDLHVVSRDGSRVFWTSIAPEGGGSRQVYVRIDGRETVQVSASQLAVPEAPRDAQFVYATPDGRYAYFLSAEKLTDDSTADLQDPDLYRFDVDTRDLVDLTVSDDPSEPANVQGVIGASDDGQVVYFAANGFLTTGAEAVPDQDSSSPSARRPKLYVWDRGEVRYIATLPGSVEEAGMFQADSLWSWNTQLTGGIGRGQVSPDGRYLLFEAKLPKSSGPPPMSADLYRFDLAGDSEGEYTCLSCLPDGAGATSMPLLAEGFEASAVSGSLRRPYLANLILPDGKILFASADALAPGDVNGKYDVYLWSDRNGAQLITSGKSPYNSFVGDASPDGTDVYFATRQRLVATDADANVDLYDARIDGGFPEPPPPPAPCRGEACQGRAPDSPGVSGAASAAVFGPGNASGHRRKTRCAKHRRVVKKHGKTTCVRKHHAKHRRKHHAKHRRKHRKQSTTNRRG